MKDLEKLTHRPEFMPLKIFCLFDTFEYGKIISNIIFYF